MKEYFKRMDSDPTKNKEPLIMRLQRVFGSLIGAIILDLVDLASFGPLGIGGFFIGLLVGWWMLSVYKLSTNTRIWLSLLAGVYCLVPFTELIPVATLITAFARLKEKPKKIKTLHQYPHSTTLDSFL